MASNEKTKSEAEARYAKAQKRNQEAQKAMGEAEAETRRIDANTARLRALRLAKEAADRAAPAPLAKKKPKARAKSIPVAKLNASNDK